jgi:hypothetical protein
LETGSWDANGDLAELPRAVRLRIQGGFTDIWNRMRFGLDAPLFAERIYIDPRHCEAITPAKKKKLGWDRRLSGRIIRNWPIKKEEIVAVTQLKKIKYCIEHWVNGVAWENTGAYEFYQRQGFALGQIMKRYEKLDKIFEEVRLNGRFRAKQEINPNNFREMDGIRINIGPSGQLIFGDGGTHRLAIALILDIAMIPAQVGCVYVGALDEVVKLRHPPSDGASPAVRSYAVSEV